MARSPDKRTGKARQGSHPKAPPPALHVRGGTSLQGGGVTIYNPVKSGQAAQKIIRQAARANDRVEVVVHLKDGRNVELMTNPGRNKVGSVGMTAKYLVSSRLKRTKTPNQDYIGTTASSLKGRLAAMAAVSNGNRYDKKTRAEFGIDDIESLEINVYHRT